MVKGVAWRHEDGHAATIEILFVIVRTFVEEFLVYKGDIYPTLEMKSGFNNEM